MEKRFLIGFSIITLTVFVLDQFTKAWARSLNYDLLITPWFSLAYTTNTGISFGMLQDFPLLPTLVAIGVIGLIIFKYRDLPKDWLLQVSVALILAGAAGNLMDRFLYSAVTDFIAFSFWPSFNIADSAVVIGGLLFLLNEYKK